VGRGHDPLAVVARAAAALERSEERANEARTALRLAIVAAYREGASVSAIARAGGVTRQYVSRFVKYGR
jgi:transposase-like protein